MANFGPFEAAVQNGATGYTQVLVPSGSNQVVNIPASVGNGNTTLLVTLVNGNAAAGQIAHVRITTEASTSITATATDTPLAAAPGGAAVRLFASPNPTGAYNIAVICSVAPSAGGQIFFTPGQGGDL